MIDCLVVVFCLFLAGEFTVWVQRSEFSPDSEDLGAD